MRLKAITIAGHSNRRYNGYQPRSSRQSTRATMIRLASPGTALGRLLLLLLSACSSTNGQKFEPYQLNGGLVAAVAGRNFVAIASDTRFMGEGGYEILSRNHLSSRLWTAQGGDQLLLSANVKSITTTLSHFPTFIPSHLYAFPPIRLPT